MDGLALAQQLRVRLGVAACFEEWRGRSAVRRAAVTVLWVLLPEDSVGVGLRQLQELVFGVPDLEMLPWKGDRKLRATRTVGTVDCGWALAMRAPKPLALSQDARGEVEVYGVEKAWRARACASREAGSQAFAATCFWSGGATSLHDPVDVSILENFEHNAASCLRNLPLAAIEGRREEVMGVLASQVFGQPANLGPSAQNFLDSPGAVDPPRLGCEAVNFAALPVRQAHRPPKRRLDVSPLIVHKRRQAAQEIMLNVIRASGGSKEVDIVEDRGVQGYRAVPASDFRPAYR